MRHRILIVIALAAAAIAPSAWAKGAAEQKINECITLSSEHSAARVGSNGMVVRDGEANYQLDFGETCMATTLSSRVTIATDKNVNVICPSGSKVSARNRHCPIRKVTAISAEAYDRHARRR